MRAEIISVGTELLLGDIVNTNAQFLARELASLGFTVYYQSVVGDNPMRLRSLVHAAKERSEVLVFTGGLGPTDDDLTKETVAEAFGDSLVSDPEELAKLEVFFKRLGREMAPNNRKQAMVPRRGQKLNNPNGTAPGVMFRQGGKYAFLLPGPPREMKPMFENEVQPILEALQDGALRSHTLHVVGMGESDVEMKLKDFVGGQNPTVALYAKEGEVHVRVTAKAQSAEQADYMSREMAKLVREVLGDIVYSDDDSSLPQTVVKLLESKGESVALAESCTGGLLAQRLTAVPGASAVFGYGVVSYANEFKRKLLKVRRRSLSRFGAVSGRVCAEMAFGAAKQGIAEYGVGITGVAGPDGGSEEKPVGLVYVGVSHGNKVWIRKLNVPSRSRDYVRHIATQNALDMLRRIALGLEVPSTKCFAQNQNADFEREGRAQWRGAVALRVLGAVLLAAAFLVGSVFWAYFAQLDTQEEGVVLLPFVQGLEYGTEAYTLAVQAIIEQEKATNPAVEGFVALPNGLVESFVVESRQEQEQLMRAAEQPDFGEAVSVAKNATLQKGGENVLLFGGSTLRPIMEMASPENMAQVSSFTYFTEDEVLEYLVFAVAYVEEGAYQEDDFNPAVLQIDSYADYIRFVLGAKGRSLYTVALDVQENDSFMTLQTQDPEVPGQSLFLFGRLRRAGETASNIDIQLAGQPLMPQAYYEEQGYSMPDMQTNYERWMQEYLAQGTNNTDLQLRQGMPAEDIAPTVVLYPETQAEEESVPEEEVLAEGEVEEEPAEEEAVRSPFSETAVTVDKALAQSEPNSVSQAVTPSSSSVVEDTGQNAVESGSQALAQSEVVQEETEEAEEVPLQPVIQRPDPRFLVVRMNGVLVRDTVANVLAAICQYEVANAPAAAVEAQAIAVHSWILNQQGSGNPAPAVRGAAPGTEMRTLVEGVQSLVLSADGYNPAFTPWFVSAANGTNSSEDLFSVERTYLQEIPVENENGMSQIQQEVEFSEEEMLALLTAKLGADAETLGEAETWFSELSHNESGYVVGLTISEENWSGLELWQNVLKKDGEPILQSPAFDVVFNGGVFRISVYGEGHGCGLSQTGATQLAEQGGQSSEQILAHYFPGTELIEWV